MAPRLFLVIISLFILSSCITVKNLEENKKDAINYLNEGKSSLEVMLVYNFLQQENDLPDLEYTSKLRAQFKYLSDLESLNTNDASELNTLRRFWKFVDPEYKIDSANFYGATGMDSITIQGLYCDLFNVSSDSFFTLLESQLIGSDYRTTHALFAFNLALKNDCFEEALYLNTLKKFEERTNVMINDRSEWTDLHIETLAFMLEANMKYKKSWIKQVLKAQQKDGGWKGKSSNETSNPHTTILAIWLIQNVITDLEN